MIGAKWFIERTKYSFELSLNNLFELSCIIMYFLFFNYNLINIFSVSLRVGAPSIESKQNMISRMSIERETLAILMSWNDWKA